MENKKQVVEKIENKEEVLENEEEVIESTYNEDEHEDLNYKISSSRIGEGSKLKSILVVCAIIFLIIVCLTSIRSCHKDSDVDLDVNSNKNIHVKATDGVSAGVNKVYDSVVYISNYSSNKKSNSGTGFVYKKSRSKAYILTNYHVVSGSDSLKVVLSNGTTVSGSYLAGDKYLDIAVVSIKSTRAVKVAEFGKASKTPLGAVLFTVGMPVGNEYQGTVTKGILSGRNRLVSVSVSGVRDDYVMRVLQTDAAMSPGSSGGPLCTSNGKVIGINSMKFVDNDVEGMAFAVAIEDIEKYLETFEAENNLKRPYLGINMLNMSEKESLAKNNLNSLANSSSNTGIVIVAVKGNTSAYGHLYRGDVVTKVNGTSVGDIAHFRYEVFNHKIGDTVALTVLRDGSTKVVKITLK